MIKRTCWIAICCLLITMTACGPGQGPIASKETVDRDMAAITKVRNEYASSWKAGSADRVAGLYADDGVVLYPNQQPVVGRSAILTYFKSFFDQFTPVDFELLSNEVTVAGVWAFDRGTYKLSMTPKQGGQAVNDQGKYLVILQRQSGGGWKVARDMDNSSTAVSYAAQPSKP
jgi:uncharacterized protein (TIGR02246 family)